MKMNFDYFQIQNLQTAEKLVLKKWGHLSRFHGSYLDYGP